MMLVLSVRHKTSSNPADRNYLFPVLVQGFQQTELSFSTGWLAYGSSISQLAHENLDRRFRLILNTNHIISSGTALQYVVFVHLSIRKSVYPSVLITVLTSDCPQKNVRGKC